MGDFRLIKKNYIVAKRNVLNELRANSMSLQELRFFSIYLSKINPKDTGTRAVRFPISDFQEIMELDRLKINYIKHVTDSLLCKIVSIPLDERGNYTSFQLFKKCTVSIDERGERFIEIDAHDDALPLMFDFKNKYFTYQLWNALSLKSSNQLRMYEILKQYEIIGKRIISVDELKELLGISRTDYTLYNNFKKRVLDSCKKALEKYTDIKITYEPYGVKGRGGKILYLKFTIKKNNNYIDKILLDDFMDKPINDFVEPKAEEERWGFLSNACDGEFSYSEMQIIYDLLVKILPYEILKIDTEVYDYLKRKYDELLWRAERSHIAYRFGYLKKILEAEILYK